MALKTANGKNVVIADASASLLEEYIVSSNISTVTLGSFFTFIWEPGGSSQAKIRVRDIMLEGVASINSQNVATTYSIFSLYSLWSSFEVLINNVSSYKVCSTDVDQAKMFVQRLYDREKTYEEFMTTLQSEMANHDNTGFSPSQNNTYIWSAVVGSGSGSNPANNVPFSQNLTEFLYGFFFGLQTHRIQRVELRIQMASFGSVQDLTKRIAVNAVGTDIGREMLLPVFNNMQIRIRAERYNQDRPDPTPMSMPLVLYHPRYEQRVYPNAFATTTTFTVNLKQDFSPNKMAHRLYYYFFNNGTSNTLDPVINSSLASILTQVVVSLNGTIKEQYLSLSQIIGYLNKNVKNEYAHGLYVTTPCLGANGTDHFSDMDAYIPMYLL